MTGEYVRPQMRQLPHLITVLEEALASWDAVRETCGPEVAGDPLKDMATAALLAGYQRVTLDEDEGDLDGGTGDAAGVDPAPVRADGDAGVDG